MKSKKMVVEKREKIKQYLLIYNLIEEILLQQLLYVNSLPIKKYLAR